MCLKNRHWVHMICDLERFWIWVWAFPFGQSIWNGPRERSDELLSSTSKHGQFYNISRKSFHLVTHFIEWARCIGQPVLKYILQRKMFSWYKARPEYQIFVLRPMWHSKSIPLSIYTSKSNIQIISQ